MASSATSSAAVFGELGSGESSRLTDEIESLCPKCEENGTTKLLLTKIPFAKEVIVMSFECPHCGYRNNEIQSATRAQEQGVRILVKIEKLQDLSRQVVKSEFAGICIPELSFEIPSGSQAGEITNVEGIISRAVEALQQHQEQRQIYQPDQAKKIDDFLVKLRNLLSVDQSFTMIVDDPSGNSFVENPVPYKVDHQTTMIHYYRTLAQEKQLGFVADDVEEAETESNAENDDTPSWTSKDAIRNEVLKFSVHCPNCCRRTETNMKVVDIPNFKEVVIMATNCSSCGVRTSEVKTGGATATKGARLTVHVTEPEDLTRDVLKSETCGVEVPELELEAGMGILSGRFTTVEGILTGLREQLCGEDSLVLGDSADPARRSKMTEFLKKLDAAISLKFDFHLILDDPAGNSYIQSFGSPIDSKLKVEYYERTFEQNEELGLNDMCVENYDSNGHKRSE